MIDPKFMKAVVSSRRDISHELWIVRIRPEEKMVFTAGQYVTVGLPGNPRMVERPYSVASSPREPELEFFLELVPEGQLTPQLYALPVGSEVYMRRSAKGRFLLDQSSGHPNHFMVATVTGAAPFVSMLRELAAREAEGQAIPYRIALIHAASVSQEFGYYEELSRLAQDHEWFRYIPSISRTWLDPAWTGELGRSEDIARKHLDGLGFTARDTTAYACGNPNMVENVKGALQRAGFTKEFLKEELYWVAEKTA